MMGIATWLATKLWGKWLLKIAGMIGSAIKWVFSSWKHALIAVLALATAYFWLSAGKWQGRAEKALAAVEAREKTIADMTAASEKNRVAQIALNQANTDAQIQIERLNRETSNIRTAAIRDASSRYADSNRLHKVCPRISGADPAAENSFAQGDDSVQADTLILSQADFDVLNARTADAIRYEEWARSLVASGLAVEAE